ncbi:MAG: VWA domain-containing protein [Acidobacteriota bacterium]|nr:VWA domain-containing protein [Acidobacteriota bacterium]
MRFLTVPFAVLGLAASPGAGQDVPLPDLFSDTIDVRVVNVEVVVTDRDGNRVQGLQIGDFELLVDGEPVPIGYFTEIDEGVARGARAEADKAEDGGLQAVPSLAPDEPVRTNYLLFIDEFFAIRRDRDRVLKRLERDLAQLGAHDRMAVVAFDGRNVARLTDWTGARDELRDAFREARKREALGIMRRADIDPAATAPDSPGAAASGPLAQNTLDGVESAPALNSVRRTATALNLSKREREIQRSVLAATATVRSFADPPGRKAMLVLTDGWEAPGFNNPDPFGPPPPSIESIYGPLVHAANRLGYTLYPVDLAGLNPRFANSPFGIGDVSVGYNAGAGAGSAAAQPSPFAAPQGLNLEWSQDAAFGYLAHETGGLPMINAFRDIALAEAATDTRHYYWLGFEPPRNQDDELHDIEIRLAGHTNLRVRSRQSYLDLSSSAELTMMVEGSVLFGGAPGKETLAVRFGPPRRARGRKILVPMEIAIPLDDVELLPMGGRFTNELEFRVTVIKEAGERSETPTEKIRISGATEPPPGVVFVYETTLLIRSHEHRYVASIYDPLTGAVLSASGTVGPR